MRYFKLVPILFLAGCFLRAPSANMTDTYIEVKNPGQSFGLVELSGVVLDSIFGYPVVEEARVGYSLAHRNNKSRFKGNSQVKMYFNKRSRKFVWRIRTDINLADESYADTIKIKSNTWYRLTTDNYGFDVYFYLNEEEGTYVRLEMPKQGAW